MLFEMTENLNLIQPESSSSIMFVDSGIATSEDLVAAVPQQMEVIVLDSQQDGITQISEVLAQKSDLESVHIVSHGEPGSLQLGTTELNRETLEEDKALEWSGALTDTGDILLYGCNVAAGDEGQAFLQALSEATGADIAASTDLTGSAAWGGDWDLERSIGEIEADVAFPSGIENFDAVFAEGHDNHHEDGSMKHGEHAALLDLVPHADATHVAVNDGSWFEASTWENRKVPTSGAKVLVQDGVQVEYDGVSEARLETLRVDGTLEFAHNQNTKMLIDTFVVDSDGVLQIGTEANPVQTNKTVEIIFTSDSAIDSNWDPTLVSRGLISHGQARIYGADKLDFASLAEDVQTGDNELVLEQAPTGWQVGDQLVLTGTDINYGGSHEDNSRLQDEELTITEIDGNRIRFTNNDIDSGDNTRLRFDHERPDKFEDQLNIYVANITRNVSFETENAEDVPIDRRGHVMFMHNSDVVVKNAEFNYLGRTDKSKLIDDPGTNVDGSEGKGTNPRGRYPLHFHRNGILGDALAVAEGNAIVNAPGWGITHHDSHAVLRNNVVFEIQGAGIASEASNETGAWINNLTIKTMDAADPRGDDRRARAGRFDWGFDGDGYWLQGAGQIVMQDNIAASAEDSGFAWFGGTHSDKEFAAVRDAKTIPVSILLPEMQSIAKGSADESVVDTSVVPLREMTGFESYNSRKGIFLWDALLNHDGLTYFEKNGSEYAHNIQAVIENFQVWNVKQGIGALYAGQTTFENGLLLGKGGGRGFSHNSTEEFTFDNIHMEGFGYALKVPSDKWDITSSQLLNSTIVNNSVNLRLTGSDFFEIENTTFASSQDNIAPDADFTSEGVGGYGVMLDGSLSLDSDTNANNGNGIAAYAWDLDNDGQIDDFGRQIRHYFNTAGSHKISLTVWDEQGATHTLTQTIEVNYSDYPEFFVDGDFSIEGIDRTRKEEHDSSRANQGWISSHWYIDSEIGDGGAAVYKGINKGIGQIIKDDWMRRGNHTLSFDVKNADVDGEIVASVWGIDGEFSSDEHKLGKTWTMEGPLPAGALPMERTKLMEVSLGGSTYDWKNVNAEIDLGGGYQFVVFQIATSGVGNSKLAIDNVKLISESAPVNAAPIANDDQVSTLELTPT
ncbi:MAG: DUF4347 domain-containing protein [Cyanobacteria bacterium]|jgi:hypothetical protein|nr:DUF4347 domain-containing protein [Cyanobacteria bacterium GSL.Bin1]